MGGATPKWTSLATGQGKRMCIDRFRAIQPESLLYIFDKINSLIIDVHSGAMQRLGGCFFVKDAKELQLRLWSDFQTTKGYWWNHTAG